MPTQKIIKRCNCKACFTLAEWRELKLLPKNGGKMRYSDGEWFEFRTCSKCGSTLARATKAPTPPPMPAIRPVQRASSPPLDEVAMLRVQGASK